MCDEKVDYSNAVHRMLRSVDSTYIPNTVDATRAIFYKLTTTDGKHTCGSAAPVTHLPTADETFFSRFSVL